MRMFNSIKVPFSVMSDYDRESYGIWMLQIYWILPQSLYLWSRTRVDRERPSNLSSGNRWAVKLIFGFAIIPDCLLQECIPICILFVVKDDVKLKIWTIWTPQGNHMCIDMNRHTLGCNRGLSHCSLKLRWIMEEEVHVANKKTMKIVKWIIIIIYDPLHLYGINSL